LIGALAGLFSSILMAMLMITYHMKPEEGHSSKRR
jgi:preprotein translocase subunit SecF